MKPIILKNHFNGNDTIILNNHISNGRHFWNMTNENLTKKRLARNNVTKEQWQQVLDAIEKGEGNTDTSEDLVDFAFNYCNSVEIDPDMRQIVLDANNPKLACDYCHYVADDEDDDMRHIVLDAKDPESAYQYCKDVNNEPQMRQIIIDSGEPEWAFRYCYYYLSDNDEMRQIVLKGQDPEWVYRWCKYIEDSEDMRQALIDSNDPRWAFWYLRDINDNKQMRQIIIDSGNKILIECLDMNTSSPLVSF